MASVSQKLEDMFRRAAFQLTMLYSTECWPQLSMQHVQQFSVVEMHILRYGYVFFIGYEDMDTGHTRKNRVQNGDPNKQGKDRSKDSNDRL